MEGTESDLEVEETKETTEEVKPTAQENGDYEEEDIPLNDMSLSDEEDITDGEEDMDIPGVDDLPLFASDRAKEWHQLINDFEAKLEQIEDKEQDEEDRYKVMKDHLKNISQEVEYTNALIEAKKKEIETESHMKQLCSRELGRFQAECNTIQGNIEDEQDRLNIIQNAIFRANERMDEFKLQMNWNQEELEQWAVAARQKEEDSLALQKYTRADEVKIKEANLHVERLTTAILKKRSELAAAVNETSTKQVEVDRLAEEFRKLHDERKDLVQTWQETIDAMKRRDGEIEELGQKYAGVRSVVKEKRQLLDDNRERLKLQTEENREAESKGDTLARILSKRREELMIAKDRVKEFADELSALKSELSNITAQVLTKRSANEALSAQIERNQIKLERLRSEYGETKDSLKEAKNEIVDAEREVNDAERELTQREQQLARSRQRVSKLREDLFKRSEDLHALRNRETVLASDISGSKTISITLQNKLQGLDKQSLHQQELIYNAEFQIQEMERKVSRIKGERTEEEKRHLQEQITRLEEELGQMKEKKRIVQAEVKKAEAEVRASRRREEKARKMKAELEDQLVELELDIGASERQKREELKRKEEWLVQHDLLRLDVQNMQRSLTKRTDEVFSLENKRQQLILSMEERCQEIDIHKDLLRSQLKSVREETHDVLMDLGDRQRQVEKLKAKFQTLPGMAGEEGVSQAEYIIRAAQQREELQRRGDTLDQEIRGKEREIRALQTTLDHLDARNDAFRQSFQRADMSSEEADQMKKLEEKSRTAKDLLFRKRKDLQRIASDLRDDQMRLHQMQEQHQLLEDQKH
jgi:chromosome segregation ATPase